MQQPCQHAAWARSMMHSAILSQPNYISIHMLDADVGGLKHNQHVHHGLRCKAVSARHICICRAMKGLSTLGHHVQHCSIYLHHVQHCMLYLYHIQYCIVYLHNFRDSMGMHLAWFCDWHNSLVVMTLNTVTFSKQWKWDPSTGLWLPWYFWIRTVHVVTHSLVINAVITTKNYGITIDLAHGGVLALRTKRPSVRHSKPVNVEWTLFIRALKT